MLGAIAEFENDLQASRQSEGIQKTLSNGVQFGRKSKLTDDEVSVMRGKREAGTKIKSQH
jgi:hypothetical protein